MLVCLLLGQNSLFLHRMKFTLPYLTALILALVSFFPARLIAGDKEIELVREGLYAPQSFPFDSIPAKRLPEKKDQMEPADPQKRPVQDFRGVREREQAKGGIKEVPRSIKKLKPKAVIDRIPIRRPPMRIPKKGIRGPRF